MRSTYVFVLSYLLMLLSYSNTKLFFFLRSHPRESKTSTCEISFMLMLCQCTNFVSSATEVLVKWMLAEI